MAPVAPPVPTEALAAALDKEQARWQSAILAALQKHSGCDRLDGTGCESGDPLDVTLAEIRQAFAYLEDRQAPAAPPRESGADLEAEQKINLAFKALSRLAGHWEILGNEGRDTDLRIAAAIGLAKDLLSEVHCLRRDLAHLISLAGVDPQGFEREAARRAQAPAPESPKAEGAAQWKRDFMEFFYAGWSAYRAAVSGGPSDYQECLLAAMARFEGRSV